MEEQHECVKIGRISDSESDWEFILVKSKNALVSLSPVSSTEMEYYYARKFSVLYRCSCQGDTADVVVSNNVEIGKIVDPDNDPILVVSIPIPVPSGGSFIFQVIREFLERIFGSPFSTYMGPVDAEMPNVENTAKLLLSRLQPVILITKSIAPPVAVCGKGIRYATGVEKPWPISEEPFHPPTEDEESIARVAEQFGRMVETPEVFRRRRQQIERLGRENPDEAARQREELDDLEQRLIDILDEMIRDMRNSGG